MNSETVAASKRIIDSLMESQESYRAAAERENLVWGRVFADPARQKIVEEDRKAAVKLRINRHQLSLSRVIGENGWRFDRGLSLACGAGRAERALIEAGICGSFHGIDISAQALETARSEAAERNFNITYSQGDLNEVALEPGQYDLVVTQNCLHHVLRLEHLAGQIFQTLRPGGILWVHDYIGETQFQYSDERLEIVNELLSILPAKYRKNGLNGVTLSKLQRREPGTLISPFEAIRSAEIMPVFRGYFEIVQKHEFNSILHLVCPVGTRAAFAESDEGRVLFELLFLLDELLIKSQSLPPAGGQYALRRRDDL